MEAITTAPSSSSSLQQQQQQQQCNYNNSKQPRQQAQRRAYGGGGSIEMTRMSPSGESASALVDCNLTSLCDHVQSEGFNNGSFSDVILHAMNSTYHLHRLILSRSSYFRNMLHGPWREANAPILTLHVDDTNVNGESISIALAYLYGHCPNLNHNNAFRVLAAASFLDLQDLCSICTDFIISELWTSNFLAYQIFAESQDYGIHGERVRNACWGYLCQSGALELREVLPKLSSQTLYALLTSNELWVPNEEKRFELALYTLIAKGAFCKAEHPEEGNSGSENGSHSHPNFYTSKGKEMIEASSSNILETELQNLRLKDEPEGQSISQNMLVELADGINNSCGQESKQQLQQAACTQSNLEPRFQCNIEQTSSSNFLCTDEMRSSRSYLKIPTGVRSNVLGNNCLAMEGPSEEGSCYQLNNNSWFTGDQRDCTSMNSSCDGLMSNDWGRCNMPPLLWGGRIVGRRDVKNCGEGICGLSREEYDAFVNIFEGGSLFYSNMTFEALLNVRKHLEELGFPGKAVNDGLWLQMLLSQRVLEIGADTCKSCCLVSMACACRQSFGYSRGVTSSGYYMHEHEHEQNNLQSNIRNVYVTDSVQGEGNGLFRPVRVHVGGGPIDGLAGIGRGSTFVPAAAWPPTRFVFSRIPFGMGNRNCQLSLGNDDPENRADHNGDVAGDGLTALVGLSQGVGNMSSVHVEQTERGYETDLQSGLVGHSMSASSTNGISVQMLDSSEQAIGIEWDNANSSISLDMKTPLSHFPPFRFSVEFEDVHRLSDGQVKHSPEVFYAGSLWKVSVQAFNDEDPQGRRTLGLFLHRRKAETTDSLRKVHMYVDSREKVTARYQLICPSKREVMIFGSLKQTGTLLPKAPKGWGWRTALLFDELSNILQSGALRIAAVVQLL